MPKRHRTAIDEPKPNIPCYVRLEPSTLERLDAIAIELDPMLPGIPRPNRSDVIRMLVERGIIAYMASTKPQPGPGSIA